MARQMVMVKNQVKMDEYNQSHEDIQYWLSKSPAERIAAVTFLVNQHLAPGQRMDKTVFCQKKMK